MTQNYLLHKQVPLYHLKVLVYTDCIYHDLVRFNEQSQFCSSETAVKANSINN